MDVTVLSESLTDRAVRAIRLNCGRYFSITSFFLEKKNDVTAADILIGSGSGNLIIRNRILLKQSGHTKKMPEAQDT